MTELQNSLGNSGDNQAFCLEAIVLEVGQCERGKVSSSGDRMFVRLIFRCES